MNIKKIVSFALFILIIMCVNIAYAAKVPSADAKASEISKYIKDNNGDVSTVGIPTLIKWYKTVGADTYSVTKVEYALKNKTNGEIREYVKNKTAEELKTEVNSTTILEAWKGKVFDTDIQVKLSQATGQITEERTEEQKKAAISSQTIAPDAFDPSKSPEASSDKSTALGNKIVGLVQAIGSIVSVGALALIGIKYMLGSAEEKADYKSTMIPYLIGAILTFCACNIVSAIYNVMT